MLDTDPRPARRIRRIRRAAALWLALAGAAGTAAAGPEAAPADAPAVDAAPRSLEALMEGMASTAGVRARFVETKEVALLSEPIVTRGTLVFVPPDRMVRTTREPTATRLVIAGDRVAFHDAAGEDAVDLSAHPVAREYVENFIVLFQGDLAALEARYEPELETEGEGWRLRLRPRHRPLSEVVDRIMLEGRGPTLRRMEMVESDGDRTTTVFEDVEVGVDVAEDELDRLLRPAGADGRARGGMDAEADADRP